MSVGGQNLWASVLWLALFVAVAAVIVLIVVWIGRRRGSTTIALDAADTLSRVWLAAVVLGVIAVVIQGSSRSSRWPTCPRPSTGPDDPTAASLSPETCRLSNPPPHEPSTSPPSASPREPAR
ncbi:MAG: hypothetical protein R2692_02250 [Microbacterium sp.]